MFKFRAEQAVPGFILNDRDGYAVAKAIEAAMQALNDTVLAGLSMLTSAEDMPAWRLDEIGWEYGLPFDYTTTEEVKRKWVERAWDNARLYGTKAGVETFLKAIFDGVEVEEWPDYAGSPYSFRVKVDGAYTMDNFARAVGAVNEMRSVRSTFDNLTFRLPEIASEQRTWAGAALYGIVDIALTDADAPDLDQGFLADENGVMMADENGVVMTE